MEFSAKDICIIYATAHISLQTKLKMLQENSYSKIERSEEL